MKWMNKGHEFDELGSYYQKTQNIYLYGATILAESFLRQIEDAILKVNQGTIDFKIYFVDRDVEKQDKLFLGYKVVSPENFRHKFNKDGYDLVINCVSEQHAEGLWEELAVLHVIRRYNAYNMYEFYRYLSLFIYYRYQKFYLHFIDNFIHTYCNLNCKGCCVQTYRGFRKRNSITQLKENLDRLFKKINYVGIFNFGIAEGFLGGAELIEILNYLNQKYNDCFGIIEIVTNGTILPNNELITCLKQVKVRVVVDDYRDHVSLAEENYKKVIDILKDHNIQCSGLKREHWDDVEFGVEIEENSGKFGLQNKLTNCIGHAKGFPYYGYKEGFYTMYSCVYQAINSYMNIVEETENDSIDIEKASPIEIIEFLMGYTDRGYISACTKCYGVFEGVDTNHIPVAIQIDKKVGVRE